MESPGDSFETEDFALIDQLAASYYNDQNALSGAPKLVNSVRDQFFSSDTEFHNRNIQLQLDLNPEYNKSKKTKENSANINGFQNRFIFRGKNTQRLNHFPFGEKSMNNNEREGKEKKEIKIRNRKIKVNAAAEPTFIPEPPSNDDPPECDKEAITKWIYPTNFPKRSYQFNIVQKALLQNTMVCLPTGLGKTFIAAVVMLNYIRWFPKGKVVFMAPSKPLVSQQIEACHRVTGIPQSETIEMTGNMAPDQRQKMWDTKRVFFVTPQIIQNDIARGSCPVKSIVCLVVDEAHKATGNYAYCNVIRSILVTTRYFRVLALTASPATDQKGIQSVVNNLLIAHLEVRTESDIDVQPYTHSTDVEIVKVPLSAQIIQVRNHFLEILKIPLERLFNMGCFWGKDPEKCSYYMIFQQREKIRQNPPPQIASEEGGMFLIEAQFGLALSLFNAWKQLNTHGLASFKNSIDQFQKDAVEGSKAKKDLIRRQEWMELRILLEQVTDQGNNHPKLAKLKEILLQHFQNSHNTDTRAMVFVQYRDSVNEIVTMLSHSQPIIKPVSFVGQSAGKNGSLKGLKQKEQQQVISQFRKGGYNTLVATCIGEEGLDIGEVDLIVCFDAQNSPTRLIQRMGRTGRQRAGRCVMLLTEGIEERTYKKSESKKKGLIKALVQNQNMAFLFYENNPRMIPDEISPECSYEELTVVEFKTKKEMKKKIKGHPNNEFLNEVQERDYLLHFATTFPPLYPEKWTSYQSIATPIGHFPHSKRTTALISTMQFIQEYQEEDFPSINNAVSNFTTMKDEKKHSHLLISKKRKLFNKNDLQETQKIFGKELLPIHESGQPSTSVLVRSDDNFELMESNQKTLQQDFSPNKLNVSNLRPPLFIPPNNQIQVKEKKQIDLQPVPPETNQVEKSNTYIPRKKSKVFLTDNLDDLFPLFKPPPNESLRKESNSIVTPVLGNTKVVEPPLLPSFVTSPQKECSNVFLPQSVTHAYEGRFQDIDQIGQNPLQYVSEPKISIQIIASQQTTQVSHTIPQLPNNPNSRYPVYPTQNNNLQKIDKLEQSPDIQNLEQVKKMTDSSHKKFPNQLNCNQQELNNDIKNIATQVQSTVKESFTPNKSTTENQSSHRKGWYYADYKNRLQTPPKKGQKSVPKGQPNCLQGKNFIITGILESLEREEAQDLIRQYGGSVYKTISKKLTHAVVGESPGPSKMEKFQQMNVKIIDEDGLFQMIANSESNRPKEDQKSSNFVQKEQQNISHVAFGNVSTEINSKTITFPIPEAMEKDDDFFKELTETPKKKLHSLKRLKKKIFEKETINAIQTENVRIRKESHKKKYDKNWFIEEEAIESEVEGEMVLESDDDIEDIGTQTQKFLTKDSSPGEISPNSMFGIYRRSLHSQEEVPLAGFKEPPKESRPNRFKFAHQPTYTSTKSDDNSSDELNMDNDFVVSDGEEYEGNTDEEKTSEEKTSNFGVGKREVKKKLFNESGDNEETKVSDAELGSLQKISHNFGNIEQCTTKSMNQGKLSFQGNGKELASIFFSSSTINSLGLLASTLRNKYHLNVIIQKTPVDILLGYNAVVIKKSFHEILTQKPKENLESLVGQFEHTYLLIEMHKFDSLFKPKGTKFEDILLEYQMVGLIVLYSHSEEETAQLIHKLLEVEIQQDGSVVFGLDDGFFRQNDVALQFLQSLPHVNIALACRIVQLYINLKNFIQGTPDQLAEKTKISQDVAQDIYDYLLAKFDTCR